MIKKTIIIIASSTLLLFGCGQNNALRTPQKQTELNTHQVQHRDRLHKQSHQRVQREHVPQTQPQRTTRKSSRDLAKHLSNLAKREPHVRKATAISLGNYSIVGIDVDPKLERDRVGTVKYSVAQALKKDPRGSNALVTADVDLVQRIREMSHDIAKGKPLKGITEELADIAGRIAPQPSRVTPAR